MGIASDPYQATFPNVDISSTFGNSMGGVTVTSINLSYIFMNIKMFIRCL